MQSDAHEMVTRVITGESAKLNRRLVPTHFHRSMVAAGTKLAWAPRLRTGPEGIELYLYPERICRDVACINRADAT